MNQPEIKTIIQEELPQLIAEDPLIRDFILRTVSEYYAGKQETESKFDRILAELQRDREEQARKWDEQSAKWDKQSAKWDEQSAKWEENNRRWEENNRRWEEEAAANKLKWDEQARQWEENNRRWDEQKAEDKRRWDEQAAKWEENNRRWDEQKAEDKRRWDEQSAKWEEDSRRWEENSRRWEENSRRLDKMQGQIDLTLQEIKEVNRKHDSTIGALGSRWGLYSEGSFRNALKGILQDYFGVEVLNLNDFDHNGEVFGHPDQVEIDIIIKNGLVLVCEIKSSMSKSDMYIFDRKVAFYEKYHQRSVTRKLVISPMVDSRALPVAENLGIEIYSYAGDVPNL